VVIPAKHGLVVKRGGEDDQKMTTTSANPDDDNDEECEEDEDDGDDAEECEDDDDDEEDDGECEDDGDDGEGEDCEEEDDSSDEGAVSPIGGDVGFVSIDSPGNLYVLLRVAAFGQELTSFFIGSAEGSLKGSDGCVSCIYIVLVTCQELLADVFALRYPRPNLQRQSAVTLATSSLGRGMMLFSRSSTRTTPQSTLAARI